MYFRRSVLLGVVLFLMAQIASAQVNYNYSFYTTSGQAFGEASADFNRDGFPDLAVGSVNGSGTGVVDVFFNNGHGQFGSFVEYPVAAQPYRIIAADLTGDGFPDLVVSYFPPNCPKPSCTAGNLFVDTLLNNGDGTFRPGPRTMLKMPNPGPMAAGDLNNDGRVDLVVEENNTTNGTSQFEVLLGNGSGTFSSKQILTMAHLSSKPVVMDFNGDGKLDIANMESAGNEALVWWGNGNGTFATPTKFAIPSKSDDLTSADFNNDGLPDLAFEVPHFCGTPPCGNNTVYVYKNNGNKTFTQVSSFNIGPAPGYSLYSADLNGDGNQDIINENGGDRAGGVDYALGKGNGTFGTQGSLLTPSAPTDFVARDFNLDSRKDVAIPGQTGQGVTIGLATSGLTNCASPGSATLAAKICTPGNNASVSSPVTVRASGDSPVGVKRLEIWIDGVKRYQRLYDQIARSFTLTAGTHHITVVAVDQYAGIAKATVTVRVP